MIILKGLTKEQVSEVLPENLILLGYRGSVVHGTYIQKSDPHGVDDRDLMGVFVGKLNHYLGFDKGTHKEKFVGEWDVVSYEIRKFVSLLLKSNPNVLGLLWIPENYIVYKNEFGSRIRKARDLFISKQVYHTFTGYAYEQLKRLTNSTFQGYMGEKRKVLVETHGYDTKNASHLIRLLRMGIEFLTDGELHVVRQDASELIQIKKGAYSLERIQSMSVDLFRTAQEAFKRSTLPEFPQYKQAELLVEKLILDYYHLTQKKKT